MLCCGKPDAGTLSCEVSLLDDTVLSFRDNVHFKKDDKTQGIFDAVCDHLKLSERDYFGLSYHDKEKQAHWLDLYKKFRDHEGLLHNEGPCKLQFGVRFFIADPTSLKDEITQHLFFLQLKQDILIGRLPCDFKKSTELATLGLQSEFGSYSNKECKPGYVSKFRFSPTQDDAFNKEVERLHARYMGLASAEAELLYLRKCRHLDMYGVDVHSVRDEYGAECQIGLSAKGIEVRKNRRKIKTHYWPLIIHIEFKDKQLKLQVKHRNCEDAVYIFTTASRSACKRLWKRSIEQHAFFRMSNTEEVTSSGATREKKWRNRDWSTEIHRSKREIDPSSLQVKQKTTNVNGAHVHVYQDAASPKNDKKRGEPGSVKMQDLDTQSEQSILEQTGLFGINSERQVKNMYVTPKSERRERNRHLRSLSDSENKHHKSKSRRGRSSGEESDSPSKRRIRRTSDQRNSNHRGESSRLSRPRHYHTDTEAVNKNTRVSQSSEWNDRERSSELGGVQPFDVRSNQSRLKRTRKKHNRLSQEDVQAQKMLWHHIHRQSQEPESYTPEQLRDIPYTEVKTEGNPLPMKLRKHSRKINSPSRRRSATSSYSAHDGTMPNHSPESEMGGLISPLSVTTAIVRDKVALGSSRSGNAEYRTGHSASPRSPRDWDTRRYGKSCVKKSTLLVSNSANH